MEADGRKPFLGTAQVKQTGPLTLTMRLRSPKGGAGNITWKTVEQTEFPRQGQTVKFNLAASKDWQEVKLHLPFTGKTGIVRLYLPVKSGPLDIQSIQFQTTKTKKNIRAWDFSGVKP